MVKTPSIQNKENMLKANTEKFIKSCIKENTSQKNAFLVETLEARRTQNGQKTMMAHRRQIYIAKLSAKVERERKFFHDKKN